MAIGAWNTINPHTQVQKTSFVNDADDGRDQEHQPEYEERDYDCADFSTHAEAQDFFESAGAGDPHRLDRDGDDVACETLP